MANNYIIRSSDYIRFGKKMLEMVGVPPGEAEMVVLSLLDADAKGIYTHGLFRMPVYVGQLKRGIFNPQPLIKKLRETSNVIVLDGDNGLGSVVSYYGMKEAIEMARQRGVGLVGVRNSNHFGAAGYWAELATLENQIGLSFTNASPAIAPTGGLEPVFGNNPWSISIPTNNQFPITLDMSNSVVPRGNIRIYAAIGKAIPLGWALNQKGQPTTDPKEAMQSKLILPIGDYKGYGITVMVDILAGVLTGANFANQVGPIDGDMPRNAGHLFIALNIESFMDPVEFKKRIDELWNIVKAVPKITEDTTVLLPGEKEWILKLNQNEGTVKIPEVSFAGLMDLCKAYGLEIPVYQVLE